MTVLVLFVVMIMVVIDNNITNKKHIRLVIYKAYAKCNDTNFF